MFQRGVFLKCSLHVFVLLYLALQTQADTTVSLKPTFIKAVVIMLSHNNVYRGKPEVAALLSAIPGCSYRSANDPRLAHSKDRYY